MCSLFSWVVTFLLKIIKNKNVSADISGVASLIVDVLRNQQKVLVGNPKK
jgi:hypothetical protein